MTTTTARKPLTATTWKTLSDNHAYLSRDYAQAYATRLHWADTADLAAELEEIHPHLASSNPLRGGPARVLTDLCVSQTPVRLTWKRDNCPVRGTTEITTTAVIVEYLSTTQARISYCGFGHWVALADILDATSFRAEVTYVTAPETV